MTVRCRKLRQSSAAATTRREGHREWLCLFDARICAKPTCCHPDNGAASAFGVQRADELAARLSLT